MILILIITKEGVNSWIFLVFIPKVDTLLTLVEVYQAAQLKNYEVKIKTGNDWWNGTHGRVKIQLFGSKGQTGWRHLRHKVRHKVKKF